MAGADSKGKPLGNDRAGRRQPQRGRMAEEYAMKARMSSLDATEGGSLVSGARIMGLFGDLCTEILIRHDADEGLLRAYESAEFLAPVYAGDYVEATARLVSVGNTSRRIELVARKTIASSRDPARPTSAEALKEPIVVAKAVAICVVPRDKQGNKPRGAGLTGHNTSYRRSPPVPAGHPEGAAFKPARR